MRFEALRVGDLDYMQGLGVDSHGDRFDSMAFARSH